MDKREPYIAIIFIIAFIFFIFELYFFNYNLFYSHGLGLRWFEQRVQATQLQNSLLFKSPVFVRSFILIMISIAILTSKVKFKLTESKKRKDYLIVTTLSLFVIYVFAYQLYEIISVSLFSFTIILTFSIIIFIAYIYFLSQVHKLFQSDLLGDRFQKEKRKFKQFDQLIENEYSVNIPTDDGWINVVNPFRASQILGTPGSGKTYSILVEAIIQQIKKGFTMMLYDYKFPTLSIVAFNALKKYGENYDVKPQFCIINFDDVRKSHKCNPFDPKLIKDPTDATEASQALMYGLYPKWSQKQGDFFPESAINFVAACIWSLKLTENGKYCTLPHLIQLISLDYDSLFKFLSNIDDEYIRNVVTPFISAWKNDAMDQLEGQIGTSRIALSRLTSPLLYWVMAPTENDPDRINLVINDKKEPKILCLSNSKEKPKAYAPILSLYNTRLMTLINKENRQKCAVIIDEFPTLSFPPATIDQLIATGRSNKIAVWLGYQDFAQLTRDLSKEIAEAIINTIANTFTGLVNFETAKKLSEKFGKINIKKESITLSKESTSVQHSTEHVELIPPSEISSLPNGQFVGQVADDRGYEIDQKIFYSKILIDHEKRKEFEKGEIPDFVKFDGEPKEALKDNFERIKQEINALAEHYNSIL